MKRIISLLKEYKSSGALKAPEKLFIEGQNDQHS